jgi:hypothetical protein
MEEMGHRRRKRIVLALLALAMAGAATSAYLGRDHLLDSWRIWQLGSSNRATRILAAEKLAERRCLRAVPEILKRIEEDTGEGTMTVIAFGGFTPTRMSDEDVEFVGGFATPREEHRTASPLVLALWNMGEGALPAIERTARDRKDRLQGLRDQEEIMHAQRFIRILDQLRDRTKRMEPGEDPSGIRSVSP